ncbi:MAG TPA: hypothetical protein VMG08_13645 [Allosphingosinicella sp.]|nr:hypothetical protein [Allosphingosinicella sp.]
METNRIILEAIARGSCVAAVYNRMKVILAPHILYTRHDELYVDAVTLERDGQPPREVKLGSFKLTGLKEIALAAREFRPDPVFDPALERYAGTTLFAVQPEAAAA